MQSSNEVLDALAVRLGDVDAPASDYAMAKALGVTPQRMSAIRHGRLYLSKAMAIRAAEIMAVEPAALINIAAAERETNAIVKRSLLKVAQAALTVSLVVGISAPAAGAAKAVNCILCQLARRRRTARSRAPSWLTSHRYERALRLFTVPGERLALS